MALTKEALHVLTSNKKGKLLRWQNCNLSHTAEICCCLCAAALLQELGTPAQQEVGIKLEFLERAKGDDGSTQIQKLLDIVKEKSATHYGALPKVCKADYATSQCCFAKCKLSMSNFADDAAGQARGQVDRSVGIRTGKVRLAAS